MEKIKNLFSKVKTKVENLSTKAQLAISGATALTTVGASTVVARADELDVNATLRAILKLVFNLLTFGGIVLIVVGVIQVVRAVSSQDQGETHNISRGVGFIIGGAIMVGVRFILQAIGINVNDFTFVTTA